jgi:hypothetical protein
VEGGDGQSIQEHFGWFYTLHHLAKDGGILRLTGEKDVTKVNFVTMLNWLSLEGDIMKEEQKKQKQILNQYKRR